MMYRMVALALVGLGLSGCTSFNLFTPTPPTVTIQLESAPPGAEATTSVGPGCKTPCSLAVTTADNFSVTFNLNKYVPETVPVQLIKQQEGLGAQTVTADPNPVLVQLKPAKPAKKPPARRRVSRPAAPPPDAAPAASSSPFPTPR